MPPPQLPFPRAFITQLFDALRAVPPTPADEPGAPSPSNPLEGAPETVKKQLLALHVAFPNELLPALDLLDRRLVTRFRIHHPARDQATEGVPPAAPQEVRTHRQDDAATAAVGLGSTERGIDHADENLHDDTSLTRGVGRMDSSDAVMLDVEMSDHAHSNTGTRVAEEYATDTVYYVRSAQARASRFSASYDTITTYEVRLCAWNCSCPAFAFSAFPSALSETSSPLAHGMRNSDGKWSFGGMSMGNGTPPVCKHLLACVLAERCSGMFGGCVDERGISVEEAAGWAAGWGD